jgi:hypothetical protein
MVPQPGDTEYEDPSQSLVERIGPDVKKAQDSKSSTQPAS